MLEQLPKNAIAATKAKGRNKCLPCFIVVRIGFVVCKITPYFLNEQENGKVIELKRSVTRTFLWKTLPLLWNKPPVYDPQPGGSGIKTRRFSTRNAGIYGLRPPPFDVLATTNTLASYSIHMGKATSNRVKTSDVGVMTAATASTTTTACLR